MYVVRHKLTEVEHTKHYTYLAHILHIAYTQQHIEAYTPPTISC